MQQTLPRLGQAAIVAGLGTGLALVIDPHMLGVAIAIVALATWAVLDVLQERDAARPAPEATVDPVTGLLDRSGVRGAATRLLEEQGEAATVFLVDLDDFNAINESLGYDSGDDLLRMIAARLEATAPSGDVVGRLNADEFAIVRAGHLDDTGATTFAHDITHAIQEPLTLGGRQLIVRGRVGAASSRHAATSTEVFRNASMALHVAKDLVTDAVAVYEPEMRSASERRLELRSDLYRALAQREFFLLYQPIVSLPDARVVGCEALIRWRHPTRGLVPPDEFIRLAEDTGLIEPIGRWVLREACGQAAAFWAEAGTDQPPLYMSVNVSVHQLERPSLVDDVRDALDRSKLPADMLVLEITESVVSRDVDLTVQAITVLKELGVMVAIDDFGTGYSSLSLLDRLPADLVKVDKSFVGRLGEAAAGDELAGIVVQLGNSFDLDTIAEGIELESQAKSLEALGCRLGQGYLFGRPLEPEKISAMILQREADAA